MIVVITDAYLKSANCMFELVQIAKNQNFYDRIFPLVLPDAQIYDPEQRLEYIEHWEDKIKKLDTRMKRVEQSYLQGVREDIDIYREIRRTIAGLMDTIRDINSFNPQLRTLIGSQELQNHKLLDKLLNEVLGAIDRKLKE